jgi:hypothetical protein
MAKVNGITVVRPRGRRTRTEDRITRVLVRNAMVMKQWMSDTNRVATGKSINSFKVRIYRQPQVTNVRAATRDHYRGVIGDMKQGADQSNRSFGRDKKKVRQQGTRAQEFINFADVGFVSGQILAAPSVKYALNGRGSGKPPPVEEILKWMNAKGLETKAVTRRESAFLIARKIGSEGTNPPHFNRHMMTTLAGVTANKLVKAISPLLREHMTERSVNLIMLTAQFMDGVTMTWNGRKIYQDENGDLSNI